MSLFGLFASLFSGGVYVSSQIKNEIHDSQNRNNARNNNSFTYIDNHGHDCLTSTGEKVCYSQGKIYSTKTGAVLQDTRADYFKQRNHNALTDAKSKGKKFAYLTYAKNGDWNNTYTCKTEIETMRKYDLSFWPSVKNQWAYGKHYKEYEGYLKTIEMVTITKSEFIDLGGLPPSISVDEYWSQSTKAAKELKKEIGGF